ncbi:MAG: hypothetical protein Ct9H90mP4_03670 [Gammaproteobacteria bacterium]|nr:MAG: hypothetical protein Ct9H90mP4_03670 [Gammaproteobacteria bacterium]
MLKQLLSKIYNYLSAGNKPVSLRKEKDSDISFFGLSGILLIGKAIGVTSLSIFSPTFISDLSTLKWNLSSPLVHPSAKKMTV